MRERHQQKRELRSCGIAGERKGLLLPNQRRLKKLTGVNGKLKLKAVEAEAKMARAEEGKAMTISELKASALALATVTAILENCVTVI